MSDKNMDQFHKISRLWEAINEEEQAMLIDFSLRRFRVGVGFPIFSLDQLRGADPRSEEAPYIETVYDRFGRRTASGAPTSPAKHVRP